MLLHVTKKSIRESSEKVLKVGYCGLQHLLNYKNRFAYSSGVYGWSCDYYLIDGVIISTGYNPIGQSINYDIIKDYDLKAEKIQYDYSMTYEQRLEKMNQLVSEFIQEVKKQLKWNNLKA